MTHIFSKILFALLFGLTLSIGPVTAIDTEPNNSIATASLIGIGVPNNGTLGSPATDIEDFYLLNLPGDGTVTTSATLSTGLVGLLQYFRTNGTFLGQSAISSGPISFSLDCIGSPQIIVRVARISGNGSYSLTVTQPNPVLPGDVEPNNTQAQANQIFTENQVFSGHLGYENNGITDAIDYFQYTNPRNGDVTITVNSSDNLIYRVGFFRSNGTFLGESTNGSGTRTFTINCQEAGAIFARVIQSSNCGAYTGSFSTSNLTYANDAEPNNIQSQTQLTVVENQIITGQIGYTSILGGLDFIDYFRYASPRNGAVTFSANSDNAVSYRIGLFRKNGTFLGESAIGTGTISFTLDCLAQDTIVGRIFSSGGCGSYAATFSTSTQANANDSESNNTIALIQRTVVENEIFTGHLGYVDGAGTSDFTDYFRIINPRNGNITLSATSLNGLIFRIGVFRQNGTFLGESANGTGTQQFTLNCQAADTLVCRIISAAGCGSYSASFSTSSQTFANDVESNNVFAEAKLTAVTQNNFGQLGFANAVGTIDGSDIYVLKITQPGFTLNVPYLFTGSLNGQVRLFNAQTSFLGASPTTAPNVASNMSFNIVNPGFYYLQILHVSGCGSFSFGAPCAGDVDLDKDNVCDASDSCLANGGLISLVSGNTAPCLGDSFDDIIQVAVSGKFGQGTFGLVTFPAQDIVALSASGTFNMQSYPEGNYRIGHLGTPSLSLLQGITNVNQLSGCFDLSNLITVSPTLLIPGTISANSSTTVCGTDGSPSIISFTSTGATGPSFRWAILDESANTVLVNNSTGSFDFDTFGPGVYRVTRAVFSGINPSTVNPQNLPACIRRSNLITVTVTSCAQNPSLISQPNPTAGPSVVSFEVPNSGHTVLEIYDLNGRRIDQLYNTIALAGTPYRINFDGSALPNGIYIYRLTTESEIKIEKFMIAR